MNKNLSASRSYFLQPYGDELKQNTPRPNRSLTAVAMNSISVITIFLLSVATASAGDTVQQPAPSPVPDPTIYHVVEKTANSRIFERIEYETLRSGRQVPHVHRYTEIATGVCRPSGN